MSGTVAKKRKINPVPLVVHKPQDAKSTVIHINMHPKKDNAASDNGINYNFENLLTEQGNLVLDYNELFTVEHQKEQMMLEIEQRRLKEADKDNNEAEIKIANTKNKDVDLADEDDDDDDEEEAEEEDEDDDEDDEDVDLDDDEKLPKEKSKDSEVVPKKRVSALKGKALVGKYDLEDPFIDDSEEVIVETSRKAKNQGVDFFVFFGEFQSKDLQR